jgi:uncharacterized protein YecT (DUF1311 family)
MMQSLCPEVVDNEVVMSGAANFSLRRKAPPKAPRNRERVCRKDSYPIDNTWLNSKWRTSGSILETLKCKNEAIILLKTKDRAWVRFQNEPVSGANEATLGGG